VGLWRLAGRGSQIDAVAVLPFTNVTADPNSEYLSNGITETLISSLSQLPDLAVRSRSSVFRYKGRDIDPQDAANQLKVQALVTGRVTLRGDSLLVGVELTDARNNRNLWSEQYNQKLSDLLTLQQQIAAEITSHLRARVGGGEEKKRSPDEGTADPEAYQLYLKGRYHWEKRTPDDLAKSKAYFNEAIRRDPNYAQAYVGMASYYNVVSDYAPISLAATSPQARAAALKALSMDDSIAEAHAVLASTYENSWQWAAAEREFLRALKLNPNDGTTHEWYGYMLSRLGRHDEALDQYKRALESDPLNLNFNDNVANGYAAARSYQMAIDQYKKTIDLDPTFASAHDNLSHVYRDMGKYDLWFEEEKKSASFANDKELLAIMEEAAKVYAKSGYRTSVARMVELQKQLAERRYVDPAEVAFNYAELGDRQQTFTWLEKAFAEKSVLLQVIKIAKPMDRFRSDPEYKDLLKRMELPE